MVVKIPKLERLMNLVSALLASREPVPFRDIVGRVIGYDDPAAEEALEKRFDRDKADLRVLGIPIEYVPAENDRRGGYLIKHEDAFLGRIDFTPEETVLLAIAGRVGTSATGGGALEDALKGALRKLAIDLPLPDPQMELSAITVLRARQGDPASLRNVASIAEAVSALKRISFSYRAIGADAASEREVDPYGIGLAWGTWYLVGFCHLRQAVRVFKVSRIIGESKVHSAHGQAAMFRVPPDFDVHDHIGRETWQYGEAQPERIRLRATAGVKANLAGATVEEASDGSRIVEFDARRPDALVGWVLAHGGGITVLEPPSLRDLVAKEAERLLQRYRQDPGTAEPDEAASGTESGEMGGTAS